MDDHLYRLVYLSRNAMRSDLDTVHQEIAQILQASRRNNQRAGVTGALMFNAGCFAQVLEGPRQAVEGVFERIQHDLRHAEVAVLAFEPVAERGFEAWSMAYVGARDQSLEEFAHLGRESGFDHRRVSGERIFELLREHLFEAETIAR